MSYPSPKACVYFSKEQRNNRLAMNIVHCILDTLNSFVTFKKKIFLLINVIHCQQ
jgi:hypothetical protein